MGSINLCLVCTQADLPRSSNPAVPAERPLSLSYSNFSAAVLHGRLPWVTRLALGSISLLMQEMEAGSCWDIAGHGSIGVLWYFISVLTSFMCIICCDPWERIKEGKFFSIIYPDFSLAVSLVTLRKTFNFPYNLIAMAVSFLLLPTSLTILLEKKGFY